MGFRFRKSINLGGGFRINFSKSGVGYSFGGKGFRITKTAKGTTRKTVSIPGTGISHVQETKSSGKKYKDSVTPVPTNKQMKNLKTNLIIIRVFLLLLALMVGATIWIIHYKTTAQTDYTVEQLFFLEGHPKIYDPVQTAEEFYGQFNESRIRLADSAWISQRQSNLQSYADDKVILYLSKGQGYINSAIFNLKENDFDQPLDVSFVFDVIGGYLPSDFCTVYQTDATYTFSNEEATQYVYCGRLNGESPSPGYNHYVSIIATNFPQDGLWRIEVTPDAYGGKGLDWIENFATPWDFDLAQYIK